MIWVLTTAQLHGCGGTEVCKSCGWAFIQIPLHALYLDTPLWHSSPIYLNFSSRFHKLRKKTPPVPHKSWEGTTSLTMNNILLPAAVPQHSPTSKVPKSCSQQLLQAGVWENTALVTAKGNTEQLQLQGQTSSKRSCIHNITGFLRIVLIPLFRSFSPPSVMKSFLHIAIFLP